VADFVAARHRSEGVELRLGEVPKLREKRNGIELITSAGIECADHLVLAIGISPNDHLARLAGLKVADGVLTDANGTTSDRNIFAVGDVARQRRAGYPAGIRIESWQNANEQPYSVARALLSLPYEPMPPASFWSSQYDMMLQVAGFPEADAEAIRYEAGVAPFWDFGRIAIGINRPREIHQFAAKLATRLADALSARAVACSSSRIERRGPAGGINIGSIDAFPEGELRRFQTDHLGAVSVIQRHGRYFAVSDRCPHAEASLLEGFIERGRIVCPVHFAEFDLVTGLPFNAPPGCGRLPSYEVEQRGDELFLLF
jgi:nitrite reductase/ring-hydroxylating ferredoxin subunit